ncbi:MAG: histidine ammonia-lyase [Candidatus Thermoplasmatota archaeon]|nr:histidine ammonia-lyase [Candidatus Thermoplasmatota archaeon]
MGSTSDRSPVRIAGEPLTVDQVVAVARHGAPVDVKAQALENVKASRAHIEALVEQEAVVYGVTTGLGDLKNEHIPHDQVEQLQANLLASHACGTGELLGKEVVRAMVLLRANALLVGASGVRPELIQALVDLLNCDVTPAVYTQGSVGSSGDLVPLAHIARALTGEGEVLQDGRVQAAGPALAEAGLEPMRLVAKEGLALINGTQFQTALAALLVHDARRLLATTCVVASMSVEGLRGSRWPFDTRLVQARPHPGAVRVARAMDRLLEDSDIMKSHEDCDKVQDPYSFRCIPQVHGAVLDAIEHLAQVVERETGSATDNPLIFPEDALVISGGNFHGEPLGLPLAYVTTALAKLGATSERRTVHLLLGHDPHLPPFLAPHGGLDSGYMIPQYVAASLVNENKALAHPVVADTVPTSGNQEDVNAMGATQALHARRVLANTTHVLAIEALAAAQAIDHHAPLSAGRGAKAAHDRIREDVPTLEADRYLRPEIETVRELVAAGALLEAATRETGPVLDDEAIP